MCHEDDATKCIIASSECATLKDASSAGHNCFIAGHMTSDQSDSVISKSAITTYCTLKCALSDLMHCFRSIWLVGCHVTSNKEYIFKAKVMVASCYID